MPDPRPLKGARGELPTHDHPRVAYYVSTFESGIDGGRAVLLVHGPGGGASSHEMQPLYDRFAASRPTYALDLPGFGASERGPVTLRGDTFVRAMRTAIAWVADRHGPIDVVASSQAAEHVAAAALELPDAVRSLALLSPTGLSRKESRGLLAWIAAYVADRRSLARFLFRMITRALFLHLGYARRLAGPVDPSLLEHARRSASRRGAQYAAWAHWAGRLRIDDVLGRIYAKLSVPTLVVYDQDPRASFERVGELEKMNPRVKSARLPPTRGLPQWDAPDATFELVSAHFEGRKPRPSHPDLEAARDEADDLVLDGDRISSPA